jgi:hypothetical protein
MYSKARGEEMALCTTTIDHTSTRLPLVMDRKKLETFLRNSVAILEGMPDSYAVSITRESLSGILKQLPHATEADIKS